jgi:hypothetical protein
MASFPKSGEVTVCKRAGDEQRIMLTTPFGATFRSTAAR